MGTSYGSFGVDRPAPETAEPDTFEWFGAPVRLTLAVNEVELIDFMESSRNVESEGMAGLAALKDGLRMLVHPDDFTSFWQVARKHRQTADDLSDLFMVLIEAVTGRPTQQPSDSSTGRLPTTESSPVESSPPAVSSGRPDLQIIRDDSAETRARIAASLAG